MNLKKRVPELMQEMEGDEEAKDYFCSYKKIKKIFDTHNLIFQNILKNIPEIKGDILDIGCAYGGLFKKFNIFNRNLHLVGVDISKTMLGLAREYVKTRNADFLFMSSDKLKFESCSFDLVLCKDTFHHFEKPIKFFKEAFRVLKKGGYLYVVDLRRNSFQDVVYQTLQLATNSSLTNAFQYVDSMKAAYTLAEIKKLLQKAGIKNYKIWNPKIGKNFLRSYGLKREVFLPASNYFLNKWILVIRKY